MFEYSVKEQIVNCIFSFTHAISSQYWKMFDCEAAVVFERRREEIIELLLDHLILSILAISTDRGYLKQSLMSVEVVLKE